MAGLGTRLVGLDVARALALFGMIVVNFKVVGDAMGGPNWLRWCIGLFEGRAAATFVVTAGVGISLMTARGRSEGMLADQRRQLLKRALFLLVVGLAFAPIWPPDILHYYGVYMLLASLLLGARDRTLWLWCAGLVLLFPLLLGLLDYEQGWNWATLEYTGFWTLDGFFRNLFFNGFHPVIPWAAFMLWGMWLGRLNLNEKRVRRSLIAAGLGLWAVVELVAKALRGLTADEDLQSLLSTEMMPPTPFYMLAGIGVATSCICLCISWAKASPENPWVRWLVPTGQLALTHYIAHVFLGLGILLALPLKTANGLWWVVGWSFLYSLGSVLFSNLWRRKFKRGPLEWVMRRVL